VTYLIEYLGEFKFIFETVFGYVSGDQMGCFEAKKTESKISCLGTFNTVVISYSVFTDAFFPVLVGFQYVYRYIYKYVYIQV
jgi:hypothetical protein